MRAKRSKKYRKLMHQYEMAFGFREPYQVLVDSNFLRAVHSFKMELIPALERTLQGQVKPLLTKCSLAAIMASQPINPKTNNPYRPTHLPPPTILPLRHCSHNENSTPIDEVECLLSLLSPSKEVKRNKEHYTLATADPPAPAKADSGDGKKRKRGDDEGRDALRRAQKLRIGARSIPGVPIVYVKRSVMILEPMSTPSEEVRDGVENSKFRAGLNDEAVLGKRNRTEDGEEKKKKKRGPKKPKGPNPLSVKKSKKKTAETAGGPKQENQKEQKSDEAPDRTNDDGESSAPKPKRRRRHHKSSRGDGNDDHIGEPSNGAEAATAPSE
ncbi:rRNA-binding ribosome biosynthesis protein UTP23 [Aspergillus novofumigatus IBT 16806]|uniref:Putative rRNA processing protein n=1 Tax=Aspergillus novofumigatus (strain IBT 16806) TaxID=1392255 RepID=A0A2I1BWP2_ASPN1|nr:putative rRNA processing protein [Aspergillus novofumigatus IBT 16806]PKX89721.1 putative rRNA processing protein [Aspergillus novofumigatus IBT 16806]